MSSSSAAKPDGGIADLDYLKSTDFRKFIAAADHHTQQGPCFNVSEYCDGWACLA